MSLLKQLLFSVTLVVAGILAGTLIVSLGTARGYLENELQAQSSNAASTLALLMSQPGNQDPATRELLMTVLFDRGQFAEIRFSSTTGETVYSLELSDDKRAAGVPEWFAHLMVFESQAQQRNVTDGWRQLGRVSVKADDRYAIKSLWASAFRLLLVVLGVGLIWALSTILLVRWFRRALKREITAQLVSIGEPISSHSATQTEHTRFFELGDVSDAIGQARERIKATQAELDSRIESLELELNRDQVTGLANRKYFINDLRHRMEQRSVDAPMEGHILLFRQRDLAAINRALSRSLVDEWLRTVGERVQEAIRKFPDVPCELARLNGSDFALLMLTPNSLDAIRLAQYIRKTLTQLQVTLREGGSRWAYALIDSSRYGDVSNVLSTLDHALMRAESSDHNDIEYVAQPIQVSDGRTAAPSETQWSELITDALEHGGLMLSYKEKLFYSNTKQVSHHQALLTLLDKNRESSTIPGFLFMPAAQRLGYSEQCDTQAIKMGLDWLGTHSHELVVRLSLASLLDARFNDNLVKLFGTTDDDVIGRLYLEIDAFALVTAAAEAQAFCRNVVESGARVGLRNFGRQPEALVYLHQAPFSYIKVGGAFVAGLLASPGSQNLVHAIVQTARKFEIKVLADGVPDEGTTNFLMRLGVFVSRIKTNQNHH